MQIDNINPISERIGPVQTVPVHLTNFIPDVAAKPVDPGTGGLDAVRLSKLTSILSEHNISLKFSQDVVTNALVVEMVDERTGEAIRQFPSEVSLKLAANFIQLQGHFLDAAK